METKRIADRSLLETLNSKKSEATGKNEKSKPMNNAVGTPASKNDYGVNLSSKAKGLAEAHAKALNIARSTPDVRADKVADLRARIKAGSYKVDPEKIADGMMKETLKDQLSTRMHEEAKRR